MHGERKHEAEDSCLKDHSDGVAHDAAATKRHSQYGDGNNDGVVPQDSPVFTSPDNVDTEKGVQDDGSVVERDEKDDFPEGGLKAWSVVLGSFCGSFSVFGIINSTAIFQEYFTANQLSAYTPSQIGWIFGTALFLTFFCGAPIGPIFDAYGPRALIFGGSILLIASIMLLGLCAEYWHFMLVYSVLNGIGGALINTPCIASIGHYFHARRGNATGIAMTSGSIGGIIFPLMLQRLFPAVGFAWATRILGFIIVFLLVLANLLVRSRLPKKKITTFKTVLPDLRVFRDKAFALLTLGIFLLEWGIFVPLTYITSYVVSHGHSADFGFEILAIMNGGSFFGRFFAGIVADMIGRMNTLILSICLCFITCFGLWLPAGESTPMIIVFSITFGFVSGSNLSLSPVCVGQMCKTENYGKYFATCWMFVAFGTLTGLPIAGQILAVCGGNYDGVIIFAGVSYVAAGLCLVAARVLTVGWRLNVIY
ncbi:transporter MCH4-like protein 10 [Phlyctema vagabunda]|uniref:Transporter MCH4-like protein 10 n=1 Tax=Phlyctema vagabunda TaxID=108571 RepID=A0ABR4PYR6_9HELO